MNSVILIGRLARDPEIRWNQQTGNAVATFTLAVSRDSKEGGADYPRCVSFGKTAENLGKYKHKGDEIAVHGRIQTGSYKGKDGKNVYTTDVIANKIEYLRSVGNSNQEPQKQRPQEPNVDQAFEPYYEGTDEDIPF